MELVKGQPITKYCDEHRLTPRQRLELFLPVCQAIQHAHQKGIIHRDIKPSNVLVAPFDGRPVVKVIDFGIAKAAGQKLTDKTLFTEFGAVVGTLEYMSPEQAELNNQDIDTRTDIYSLGVLLYELLTGTTPISRQRLKEAAFVEVLRIIREEEPAKPSTRLSESKDSLPSISAQRQTDPGKLTRVVRGELDWIVMKALEKDRNRRYETANGFAMDVQRYLADEPVLACPPSGWYRFKKFTRRNKASLVTVAAVAVTLIAGGIAATWQAIRARDAERRVKFELLEKDKQFQRAEANFLQTLEAVDGLLTEVGQKDLASVPQFEQVRRRLLEKALRFFQEFLQARGDDPTVRFEAALAYRRVGEIQRLLGQNGPGAEASKKAIDHLESLRAEHPEQPSYRHELARTYSARGLVLAELGRREAMEQDFQQARDLLQGLTREYPDRPDYSLDLARTLNGFGERLGDSKPAEAVGLLRQGLRLVQELAEKFPDRPDYIKDLVRGHGTLAKLLKDLRQVDEATKSYQRCNEVVAQGLERFAGDQDLRWLEQVAHLNYGVFLWRKGEVGNAEKQFHLAAKVGKQLADDFPSVPRYQSNLSGAYSNLGGLLWGSGQEEKAEEPLKQGVAIAEKLAADYPTMPIYRSEAGFAMDRLAVLLTARGRHAEARTLLVRATEHQEAAHGLDPSNRKYREGLSIHAMNLALVLKSLKAPPEELAQAHERTVTVTRALVKDHPKVAEYQSNLGKALSNWASFLRDHGEAEKALPLLEEAVKCQKEALKTFPQSSIYLDSLRKHYMLLAEVLIALDRPGVEDAIRGIVTTATDLEAVSSDKADVQSGLGAVLHNLALKFLDRRKWEPARQLLEQAVGHQQAALRIRPENVTYLVFLRNHYSSLAYTLKQLRQPGEAEAIYRLNLPVLEKLVALRPDEPDYPSDHGAKLNDLALLLKDRQGDLGERRKLLEQAVGQQQAALKRKPTHPVYRRFLGHHFMNLGDALVEQHQYAKAEKRYGQGLEIREKLAQESPTDVGYQEAVREIKNKLEELARLQSKKDR
jgi:tetratricopeptide (TPR) repeat protein